MDAWIANRFTLLSNDWLIAELRDVTRRPHLASLIKPYDSGKLVNLLHQFGEEVINLPDIDVSPDPNDNFLLAMAQLGKANWLVTGDKAGLLALRTYNGTSIVTVATFHATLFPNT